MLDNSNCDHTEKHGCSQILKLCGQEGPTTVAISNTFCYIPHYSDVIWITDIIQHRAIFRGMGGLQV
jgi:hypothetical protein